MNSRTLGLGLLAIAVAVAVAACSNKKKTAADPLIVNNDVYTTGEAPNRLLLSGDTLYIVNSLDNTVDKVNLDSCTPARKSCQRAGQTILPAGTDPYDLALFKGSLWVAGDISNTLYEISTSSMAVIATVNTGAGFAFSSPESLGVAGSSLLVSNANYNATGAGPGFVSEVIGTSIVGQFATSRPEPQSFATWPTGDLALVDDGAATFNPTGTVTATTAGAIDLLNAAGTAITSSIPMGLTLPGPGLVLSANEQSAFTGSGAGGFLIKIDVATLAVTTDQLSSLAASPTTSISYVVEDPGTHTLYALSFNEDRVYAVNEDTLAPVTLGSSGSFVTVGPGLPIPEGPVWAVIWQHNGVKHLLVLLNLGNAVTDIIIP